MPISKKIRVLVVDDSLFIRRMFSGWLNDHPAIEVVGTAADPFEARELIKQLNPDVLTLDIEMPKMDGIRFLEKLMRLRPMPVIMASTLTAKGADTTLEALALGAVDYITKPSKGVEGNWESALQELTQKILYAATARVGRSSFRSTTPSNKSMSHLSYRGRSNHMLIAIGASTGGVEALSMILSRLPGNLPPIVITQHMPPLFTASFAKRLNEHSALNIREATTSQLLEPGTATIAAGGRHLKVTRRNDGRYYAVLDDSAAVSGHRPSVDVLFHSVAEEAKNAALGIILTGMGHDGADGLLAMRNTGAMTFGQSEESCVVFGMPKAAIQRGAVTKEIELDHIAQAITTYCEGI